MNEISPEVAYEALMGPCAGNDHDPEYANLHEKSLGFSKTGLTGDIVCRRCAKKFGEISDDTAVELWYKKTNWDRAQLRELIMVKLEALFFDAGIPARRNVGDWYSQLNVDDETLVSVRIEARNTGPRYHRSFTGIYDLRVEAQLWQCFSSGSFSDQERWQP